MTSLIDTGEQNRGKWVWVRINGILDDPAALFARTRRCPVKWWGGQQERGENGGDHWQGMLQFEKKEYPGSIHGFFRNACFNMQTMEELKYAWGTLMNTKDIKLMYEYIKKQRTRTDDYDYEESGEFMCGPHAKRQAKKESGVQDCLAMMKDLGRVEGGLQFTRGGGSTQAYKEAIERLNLEAVLQRKLIMQEQERSTTLRPWQKHLKTLISGKPDPRKIIVVLDKKGNCGKTYFMKHYKILNEETTVNLSNGRTSDLSYIVQQKPGCSTIFYNLVRTTHGIINYQAMEQFKDGEFCPTKYAGSELTMPTPHLVVFTNEPLNWEACSKDRWHIIELENAHDKFTEHNLDSYLGSGGTCGVSGRMSHKDDFVQAGQDSFVEMMRGGDKKTDVELA